MELLYRSGRHESSGRSRAPVDRIEESAAAVPWRPNRSKSVLPIGAVTVTVLSGRRDGSAVRGRQTRNAVANSSSQLSDTLKQSRNAARMNVSAGGHRRHKLQVT